MIPVLEPGALATPCSKSRPWLCGSGLSRDAPEIAFALAVVKRRAA